MQCNFCDRRFRNLAALNGHMRLHGGYIQKKVWPSSSNHFLFVSQHNCVFINGTFVIVIMIVYSKVKASVPGH